MKRNLKAVPDFVADGPFTIGQVRFYIYNAEANGLLAAGAVVRVSRRVYIDVDAFESWIDAQNPQASSLPMGNDGEPSPRRSAESAKSASEKRSPVTLVGTPRTSAADPAPSTM